jgi:hypothetical protein
VDSNAVALCPVSDPITVSMSSCYGDETTVESPFESCARCAGLDGLSAAEIEGPNKRHLVAKFIVTKRVSVRRTGLGSFGQWWIEIGLREVKALFRSQKRGPELEGIGTGELRFVNLSGRGFERFLTFWTTLR